MPVFTINNCMPDDTFVYLDGEEVQHAVYADTDEGVIERYVCGDDGSFVIEGDGLKTETLRGAVEVKRGDGETAVPIGPP